MKTESELLKNIHSVTRFSRAPEEVSAQGPQLRNSVYSFNKKNLTNVSFLNTVTTLLLGYCNYYRPTRL
jgi:hypothetical protein